MLSGPSDGDFGGSPHLLKTLTDSFRLVLSHIRKRLGFSRAIGLYSGQALLDLFLPDPVCPGAAPLSEQTFQYFQSLDLPILELLGSSETCGPQSTSMPGMGTRVRLRSIVAITASSLHRVPFPHISKLPA